MYSSTLPSTSVLDGVGDQLHTPAALPPGKTRYPLYRRLGGHLGRVCTGAENLAPHRDSIHGPSSTQRVAIPTELSRPLVNMFNTTKCVTSNFGYFCWLLYKGRTSDVSSHSFACTCAVTSPDVSTRHCRTTQLHRCVQFSTVEECAQSERSHTDNTNCLS